MTTEMNSAVSHNMLTTKTCNKNPHHPSSTEDADLEYVVGEAKFKYRSSLSLATIFEIMSSTASRYLMESGNLSDHIAGDES